MIMRILCVSLFMGICFMKFGGCAISEQEGGFSLASYNVQTLFDDQLDGSEFSDFLPSANGWNSKKYHNRLRQLARVIHDLAEGAPDILVLQEIENSRVLEDLDRYFLRDLDYKYVALAGADTLSTAVLSRWPFLHTQVHGVHWEGTRLRPLLEVQVEMPGSDQLTIYAVHWKSKRGKEAQETEELRRASAHVLAQAIAENLEADPQALIIVAGDFNEDIHEFVHNQSEYHTAVMPASEMLSWQESGEKIIPLFVAYGTDQGGLSPAESEGEVPLLYHLWEESEGSYFFNGRWEKIDQILFSRGFFSRYNQIDFRAFKAWYLLDSASRPRRYQIRNTSGYSDHLPIVLEASLE